MGLQIIICNTHRAQRYWVAPTTDFANYSKLVPIHNQVGLQIIICITLSDASILYWVYSSSVAMQLLRSALLSVGNLRNHCTTLHYTTIHDTTRHDTTPCFYFPAQLLGGFTLSNLLDKPWSHLSSLLPPGTCLPFLSRIGFSIPTARRSSSNVANSRSRAFRYR